MNAPVDIIQEAIGKALGAAALGAQIPIVARVPADPLNNIEAACAQTGICLFVMPTEELETLPAEDGTVYFTKAEARVRIIEIPQLNASGLNAYDLKYTLMRLLNGNTLGDLLGYPLFLASRPIDSFEGPIDQKDHALNGQVVRLIDVIFHTAYGLPAAS